MTTQDGATLLPPIVHAGGMGGMATSGTKLALTNEDFLTLRLGYRPNNKVTQILQMFVLLKAPAMIV